MELVKKQFYDLTLDELYDILKLRVSVFVVEQNCPYPELDGKDRLAFHVFLTEDNELQAYLRVLNRGDAFDKVSLSRVIAAKRGCGLGARIVAEGIRAAKEQFSAEKIVVAAQSYAKGFYEKQGFRQTSEEFFEDGIPHIMMQMDCG